MDLPRPQTPELEALVPDDEARVIYEFLWIRRQDPPTMVEIRAHVTQHYGTEHSQTDRRLRDLRDKYRLDVRTERLPTRGHVYRLAGRLQLAADSGGRKPINLRTRAAVLIANGSRCAMCGRSPSLDAIRLVVDHKVPKAWGGTDSIENLQPLCDDCNAGKQAHYSSFDEYAPVIRLARQYEDAHTRIGTLLRALKGLAVPSDLIAVIAGEGNAGDYKKRLRELRYILGWDIVASKKRIGRRTHSYYTCNAAPPFPPEGAKTAVAAHEARRRAARAASLDGENVDREGTDEGTEQSDE